MEPLVTVLVVLAIATFATGMLLPLTGGRPEGHGGPDEELLAAEHPLALTVEDHDRRS